MKEWSSESTVSGICKWTTWSTCLKTTGLENIGSEDTNEQFELKNQACQCSRSRDPMSGFRAAGVISAREVHLWILLDNKNVQMYFAVANRKKAASLRKLQHSSRNLKCKEWGSEREEQRRHQRGPKRTTTHANKRNSPNPSPGPLPPHTQARTYPREGIVVHLTTKTEFSLSTIWLICSDSPCQRLFSSYRSTQKHSAQVQTSQEQDSENHSKTKECVVLFHSLFHKPK